MTKSVRFLRKLGILLAGIPVVIVGIILIPLPGPGLLIVLAGLFILSLEFEWAKKYVDIVRAKLDVLAQKARGTKRS